MTLLQEAIDQLKYLKSNEVFTVQDLFRPYVWRNLSLADRGKLGNDFFSYIDSSTNLTITILGKTNLGQQEYKNI